MLSSDTLWRTAPDPPVTVTPWSIGALPTSVDGNVIWLGVIVIVELTPTQLRDVLRASAPGLAMKSSEPLNGPVVPGVHVTLYFSLLPTDSVWVASVAGGTGTTANAPLPRSEPETVRSALPLLVTETTTGGLLALPCWT